MKHTLIGLVTALALAVGVFVGNGTTEVQASDGRYTGCNYGQSCYVSWQSGFGVSIAHYYGIDQWGNSKYVEVWKTCWSKSCNHYHYSGYDRGVAWYYVYVSHLTGGSAYILNLQCQGGGGGSW